MICNSLTIKGLQFSYVDLRDATSPSDFTKRIQQFVGTKKPGDWILGGDWEAVRINYQNLLLNEQENWGGQLPNKTWVDDVSAQNPVFVTHSSGHMGLCNSLTLQLANITRYTPEVPGGTIGRDQNGDPTGMLFDEAMNLVSPPKPTPQEEDKALILAMRKLNSYGITAVVNMGHWNEYLAHKRCEDYNLTLIF